MIFWLTRECGGTLISSGLDAVKVWVKKPSLIPSFNEYS